MGEVDDVPNPIVNPPHDEEATIVKNTEEDHDVLNQIVKQVR
jgi:hypothetical protein